MTISKKWILGIVTTIIGVIATWYIFTKYDFIEVFGLFENITWLNVSLYLFASLGIMLSLTARWNVILKSQNINIPFFKVLAYRISSYMLGYITPFPKLGGEPIRAVFLKRHNVPLKKAFGNSVTDAILEIFSSTLFFLIGVSFILFFFPLSKTWVFILIAASILMLALSIWLLQSYSSNKGFITRIFSLFAKKRTINKIYEFEKVIIDFYKNNKRQFLKAMLFSILSWMCMFLEFYMAANMLGFNLRLFEIFMIITFVGIAYMMPLPLALGSLEAGQLSAFVILGLQSTYGLALSLVVRTRDLIWTIIGIIISAFIGVKFLQNRTSRLEVLNKDYEIIK